MPFLRFLDPWDGRQRQDVSPETGLTLRQAMLFYDERGLADRFLDLEEEFGGDPPLLVQLDGYPTSTEILGTFETGARELRITRLALETSLLEDLRCGRLVTTGFAPNDPIDEPARTITSDRWRVLKPDFKRSEATGTGLVISGVLVFRRAPAARASEPRRFSGAAVRAWYSKWVSENEALGKKPSRNEDLQQAREKFGRGVSREYLRDLRREMAPPSWTGHGRRKSSSRK